MAIWDILKSIILFVDSHIANPYYQNKLGLKYQPG